MLGASAIEGLGLTKGEKLVYEWGAGSGEQGFLLLIF
jgi:hypothetical protein